MLNRRHLTLLIMVIALFCVSGATGAAFAEEATSGGGARLSVFGMIVAAGPPEYLLILFSMVGFAVAIQGFMTIKKEAIIPNGLGEDLHNVLSKDGPTDEAVDNARAMVDSDPSMTGKVLSAALAVSDLGHDAMMDAADDVYVTETIKWMQKPGWCSLFANQATLLGLFGTVWGIIESFIEMAANPAGVDIVKLSSTIGVSLITTANGMAIAVPMLLFAFLQRTKLTGFFRESNDTTKEILNYWRTPTKG